MTDARVGGLGAKVLRGTPPGMAEVGGLGAKVLRGTAPGAADVGAIAVKVLRGKTIRLVAPAASIVGDSRVPQVYMLGTRLRYDGVDVSLATAVGAQDQTLNLLDPLVYSGGIPVPSLSTGQYFSISLVGDSGLSEIAYVVSYVQGSTTMVVLRAREGTTASSVPAGTRLVHGPTSRDLDDMSNELSQLKADVSSLAARITALGG